MLVLYSLTPDLFVSRSPSRSKLIYWQLNSQPILPIRSFVPSTRATRRSVSLVLAQTLGNATKLHPFVTNDLLRVRSANSSCPEPRIGSLSCFWFYSLVLIVWSPFPDASNVLLERFLTILSNCLDSLIVCNFSLSILPCFDLFYIASLFVN